MTNDLAHDSFDPARQFAVAGLVPAHAEDLTRLLKLLCFGSQFQILLAEINHGDYRADLVSRIDQFIATRGLTVGHLQLDGSRYPDMGALEQALIGMAQSCNLIHIEGGEFWFDVPRLEKLNIRREAIAQAAPVRLLFWLNTEPIRLLIQHAPDFWAWRSGVYSFLTNALPLRIVGRGVSQRPGNLRLEERRSRLLILQRNLSQMADVAHEIKFAILDEVAELLCDLGDLSAALTIRIKEQLPIALLNQDANQLAEVYAGVAHIFRLRGELGKGVNILRKRVLPIYLRNCDKWKAAYIHGLIAAMLIDLGNHGEALKILQNSVIPVFDECGDKREKAVAQRRVALIFTNYGDYDAALHLLRENVLPSLMEINDRWSIATTKRRIGQILFFRSEYQEALRILKEEVLPVYAELGIEYEVANTQIHIATILRQSGEAQAAYDLLQEHVMSVARQIEAWGIEVAAQHEMARCLVALNQFSAAQAILKEGVIPRYQQLHMAAQLEQAQHDLAEARHGLDQDRG